MMKLVLIRHGESEWNKLNLFTGWMDVDLSDKGREEAKNAGKTLKEEGYDFDVCYTSYLKRAIHTANLVLDEIDEIYIPQIKSWKLNERHYGALQGLNKSETAEKYGEDQAYRWSSEGVDGYTITDAEKEGNGSVITLYMKDDTEDE